MQGTPAISFVLRKLVSCIKPVNKMSTGEWVI